MKRSRWYLTPVAVFSLAFVNLELTAQVEPQPQDEALLTAEGVVNKIYELVSFEADTTPDWDAVRSLFLDEAVIVLRTGRFETGVFTVDGFVDDFVSFIERANVEETGFQEQVIRTRPWVFKDMAQILVLYEASIPGSGRPPQQGVDVFSLVRRDGRWWIAAVTNDIPDPMNPVPPELMKEPR
jgi:hypothetical protein